MALSVSWGQKSGYSFGTFQERSTLDLPLPILLPLQFDSNYVGPNIAISNSDLTATATSSITDESTVLGTYAITLGKKVMFSVSVDKWAPRNEFTGIGVASRDKDLTSWLGDNVDSIGFWDDGVVLYDSTPVATGSTYNADNSIVDVAVDRINHKVWFRVNGGRWNNNSSANPANTTGGISIADLPATVYPAVCPYYYSGIAGQLTINETSQYSVPSGFTLLGSVAGETTFTVISGSLPPGLRILGTRIVGTPYEVPRETTFEFCIRASNGVSVSDRTFYMTIEGADPPEFITPTGSLTINPNHLQYFVLDSTYVDFQIEATDRDTSTGQTLSFFVADNDGALPPGLSLTKDGRIVGLVEPALSIKPEDGDGSYDTGYYDAVAFDFGSKPSNGYDSYIYDTVFFDFSLPAARPKKLNRNYEFIVTITDGDTYSKRKFKIFVVGDDYFRADNLNLFNSDGLFTADATYLRAPIWLTPSDLGLYRANNYVTLILDTYDTYRVLYNLDEINADIISTTNRKVSSDNDVGTYSITVKNTATRPSIGQYLTFGGLFTVVDPITGVEQQPDYRKYTISYVSDLGNNEYRLTVEEPLQFTLPNNINFYIGDLSELPPGMTFDALTSEIYGVVPYQPAITTHYKFTVSASRFSDTGEFARSPRIFTISIIGEVESIITWISPTDLGAINANYVSTLKVEASSTVAGSNLLYTKVDGRLPPGLKLNPDGEIIGKANQYYNSLTEELGLTRFYDDIPQVSTKTFTEFNDGTSIDRSYTFTVEARDQLSYSATTKTFTITVDTPNAVVYGNIRTKPFLKISQRAIWKDFINDSEIFTPGNIYRPNDPAFGVQTELSMLVYAGIETTQAAAYVAAMGLNHKRKRFMFGDIKKATAVLPGTTTEVYEVVYIQMVDPLEPNNTRLPTELTKLSLGPTEIKVNTNNDIWLSGYHIDDPLTADAQNIKDRMSAEGIAVRPDPKITIDGTGYEVSNSKTSTYYPNSISNWRDRIKASYRVTEDSSQVQLLRERNYLPLWMRSIQPGTKRELDFQLAVPICFCKAGAADDIILNIKHSGFDFKNLDFTADRYIIDSVEGEIGDKYLVFKNDRITV